VVQTLNNLMQK